jgi:hypothetical protein
MVNAEKAAGKGKGPQAKSGKGAKRSAMATSAALPDKGVILSPDLRSDAPLRQAVVVLAMHRTGGSVASFQAG